MKTPKVPEFRLRFPLADIERWATAYDYTDDTDVLRIGKAARARGFYTRDDLLAVARWKTTRSSSRVALNDPGAVEDATRLALTTKDERLRIGVLTLLQGVEIPTASVLLHLAHSEPYPILDVRALWSLGIDPPPSYYAFDLWWAYVGTCRSIALKAGLDKRTLDRALWQYSNDTQSVPRPRGSQ